MPAAGTGNMPRTPRTAEQINADLAERAERRARRRAFQRGLIVGSARAKAAGILAHKLGLGLHNCPYTNRVYAEAWREGWNERRMELEFIRVAGRGKPT